jgi:hypothetical protein
VAFARRQDKGLIMFTLKVFRGDRLVQELDLNGPEVKIGRSADNPVILADDGKGVSRVHAIIRVEGEDHVLYDGNSRNGTYVDGKPIKRMVIQPGQDFVIGPYRLVFGHGEMSGSIATIIAARETVAPVEPPREGTARGAGKTGGKEGTARGGATGQMKSSEGSTKGRGGVGLPPPPAKPGQRQGMPTAYVAAGAIALFIVAGVVVWQLMPKEEVDPVAVLTTTTTVPETTTTIPEVTTTIDPHAEQIAQATAALEAAEATLATGKGFGPSAREFDRIVKELIAPILAIDPQYTAAVDLETRAKAGAAEARKQLALLKTTSTPPPPPRAPDDVAPREGESATDYDRRNKEVKTDYALAKKYFNDNDFASAFRLFNDLASREPGYLDVSAYVKNAQDRLAEVRRLAMNEALMLEGEGFKAASARNIPEALSKFIAARKAFEHAASLGAPGVEKEMANNLERRRVASKEALDRARTHANNRNFGEARKWYQLVIDALPQGEPLRDAAGKEIVKVSGGEFFDAASFRQHSTAAASLVRRSA